MNHNKRAWSQFYNPKNWNKDLFYCSLIGWGVYLLLVLEGLLDSRWIFPELGFYEFYTKQTMLDFGTLFILFSILGPIDYLLLTKESNIFAKISLRGAFLTISIFSTLMITAQFNDHGDNYYDLAQSINNINRYLNIELPAEHERYDESELDIISKTSGINSKVFSGPLSKIPEIRRKLLKLDRSLTDNSLSKQQMILELKADEAEILANIEKDISYMEENLKSKNNWKKFIAIAKHRFRILKYDLQTNTETLEQIEQSVWGKTDYPFEHSLSEKELFTVHRTYFRAKKYYQFGQYQMALDELAVILENLKENRDFKDVRFLNNASLKGLASISR